MCVCLCENEKQNNGIPYMALAVGHMTSLALGMVFIAHKHGERAKI